MFNRKPSLTAAAEAEQIRRLSEMEGLTPDSEEYKLALAQVVSLETVKIKKTALSKDALLGAAVTVLMGLMIIHTEVTGSITTKAFSVWPKPKI